MSRPERIVITNHVEVAVRLTALGLTEEILLNAVRAGAFARATTSTGNYPKSYSGLSNWALIVKTLRDSLLARRWRRDINHGLEGVANPDDSVIILVESGDGVTGDPNADPGPTTKYPKGEGIEEAVQRNYFLCFDAESQRQNERIRAGEGFKFTWFLLHAMVAGEIRVELSRPLSISAGFVEEWLERIILTAIPPEGGRLVIPTDNPVNPDVEVRRRA